MNYTKEHKALQRLVEAHGLVYSRGTKHYVISDRQGRRLACVSHSPNCQHFARQTVRELVLKGVLPKHVKGVKF